MVTVKNYHVREGEKDNYISLELEGDIEMVQSTNTGRFYATVRKCFISSTFSEATAKLMIGKQMTGSIARVDCEPYEYVIEETGETIELSYRYDYVPENNRTSSVGQSLSLV